LQNYEYNLLIIVKNLEHEHFFTSVVPAKNPKIFTLRLIGKNLDEFSRETAFSLQKESYKYVMKERKSVLDELTRRQPRNS